MFIVKWNEGRVRGWLDLLPQTFASIGVEPVAMAHKSLGPGGDVMFLRCYARSREGTVEIDYGGEFAASNKAAGLLYIGITRLVLPSREDGAFEPILWRENEGAKWETAGAQLVDDLAGTQLPELSSNLLVFGQIYSRRDLKQLFSITDATINTGVFEPANTSSIWLFVTEKKTKDRTQYRDELNGDLLNWDGQTQGKTDKKIIGHQADQKEILVFFRKTKRDREEGAFRYEGRFQYLSHQPGQPTRFRLQRAEFELPVETELSEPAFDPNSVEDQRRRVLATIVRRQGQPAFRQALMEAYGGRCAVTGCEIRALLEAAHIIPFGGVATNLTSNGLLLRADIHTLFDLGLLAVSDAFKVTLSSSLKGSDYEQLEGKSIWLPQAQADQPSKAALAHHRHLVALPRQ
jgi:putative restriction endonuclease